MKNCVSAAMQTERHESPPIMDAIMIPHSRTSCIDFQAATSLPSQLSFSLNPQSAAVLFGGPPPVEFYKQALRFIPSLRNCRYIDDLYDNLFLQAYYAEPKVVKIFAMKVLAAKRKMYDACTSDEDRCKAIELAELNKLRNRAHVNYMYEQARDSMLRSRIACRGAAAAAAAGPALPSVTDMRPALKSVPSLNGGDVDDLIGEFDRLFTVEFDWGNCISAY
ncbi:hypothetical protein BC830DRAFT_368468 [Chytriomyces sp. MP71]|nr:hypothetical protein BC830DRAFT_368468 [Chytriomyces sp. MP71]